jgi:V/A-type H+-transporting ATPase subunit I
MRKQAIGQFAFIGDDLPKLTRLKNMVLEVVSVSGQGGKAFLLDRRIADGAVVAEQIFADQTHAYYALAAPASDAEALKGLIDDHGLHVQAIPQVENGAAHEIDFLDGKLREADIVLAATLREANGFADGWLRKASLAAGHYESEKNLAATRTGMAASQHMFVARGYVKTEDLEAFRQRLEKTIPGASLMECDAPAPAKEGAEPEEPPVSMKWNKWIAPAGLLARMYGTPSYKCIDPTPYVATIFFIFVGICLGDAVYGLMLIGIMAWLKRKYRDQAHLQDFFQCFTYCGIAAVVVGFFTGSWLGDLTSILPGMGWADRIRTKFALIDPIKDSQLALYIAVGIGVVTQIYGMALRAYRDLRRGDKMGAFSDGILWIAFLVFAILGGATGASVFWILFVATCVLLIFTQGRDQKGWIAKILVGVVALYGIVGAYGASAILGDLISYARLMALCLTGAALGSTFNMLGNLSTEIPAVGVIVGILVVIGGHLMSFFLNLLGGFVHSARLIMLEFFGRFYEAGGTAYKPYGFDSATVDVKAKK